MKTLFINIAFIFQITFCFSQSNNLVLNQPYARFFGNGFYSIIPSDLRTDLTLFYADVLNNGTATQTNVSLNVKISNSASTLFDETGLEISAIAPDSSQIIYLDNLGLLTFILPPTYDNYTINYTVNQIETEESVNDNKASVNFAISDSVYARDVENNSNISPQQYGGTDGDFVGTSYYFPIQGEVNSLSVFIDSNTAIGAIIIGKIITGIGTGNINEVIYTANHDITSNDLGKWLTIPFINDGSGEFITQNQMIYVGVECYGNVVIGADSSAIHDFANESIIRINDVFQSVYKVPLVRLNIYNSVPCLCCVFPNVQHVSCNGSSDGSATVASGGGNMPYTYLWSSGEVTQSISGLSAGAYIVTVTDASFDEYICTVTINEPNNIYITSLPDWNSIEIHVAGGTPPYSYLWNTGDTTSELTNIPLGCYSVTVTDANDCTATEEYPCAVEQINQNNFNIFHNKITNKLIIENAEGYNLEIFNIIGTKVLEAKCTEQRTTIDVSALQNGTYVLRISCDNSFIYRKICIISSN